MTGSGQKQGGPDPPEEHIPVLAGPALEWLGVREDGTYVDCTAGGGGHSERIAQRLRGGTLIAIDRDIAAVDRVTARLARYSCARVVHANYGDLEAVLGELGIARLDGVLIDAGLSSPQLDSADRGFSFQQGGPLDMRMDTSRGVTAQAFLHDVGEGELTHVLREYGDLKKARALSAAICRRCAGGKMQTTSDLTEAVCEVFDFVQGIPDEVRTVFQSIRIAVNDEFNALERGVRQAISLLSPGGRIVCISFHSGEDRIVKNAFREASRKRHIMEPDGRLKETVPPVMKLLTRKPVVASAEEKRANSRAQSAKLRAAERLPA